MAKEAIKSHIENLNDNTSKETIVLHYLGPPGTYSHQVALDLIPELKFSRTGIDKDEETNQHDGMISLKPCKSIRDTIKAAQDLANQSDLCSLALLPFENNSNGPVIDSYDILHNAKSSLSNIQVMKEANLPVCHSLLVSKEISNRLKGNKAQIELSDLTKLDEISSHSQALGQCTDFIRKHLRADVCIRSTNSTGEAARQLSQPFPSDKVSREEETSISSDQLRACIASRVCTNADVYDLEELFSDIQNSSGNTTRFLLCRISKGGAQGQEIVSEKYDRITSENFDRCRFLFHLSSKDINDGLLNNFLRSVHCDDENAFEMQASIRKIDRSTIRKDDSKGIENGTQSDDRNQESTWAYTYLIEIDLFTQKHEGVPHKKQKMEKESDSTKQLQEAALRFGNEKESEGIYCLGHWFV